MALRVGFAGTPEFAAVALRAVLRAGFEVPLVLTQPDRPAGRGLKLQASAVKQTALEAGLTVIQPRGLKLGGRWSQDAALAQAAMAAARLDALVVAAYGLILPSWVLEVPRLGCLNIHASILPRWRGAAPIHRAVQEGDALTGICIMQMDEGLDTGDVLLQETLAIAPQDTTGSLHDRLAPLGGRLIVEALELAACGGLRPVPQSAEGVTYAHKVDKAEARLDWTRDARVLERSVRAFDPFPAANFAIGPEAIKVWKARAADEVPSAPPGTVVRAQGEAVAVACGSGVLELLELQKPSAKRQAARVLIAAGDLRPGMVLG